MKTNFLMTNLVRKCSQGVLYMFEVGRPVSIVRFFWQMLLHKDYFFGFHKLWSWKNENSDTFCELWNQGCLKLLNMPNRKTYQQFGRICSNQERWSSSWITWTHPRLHGEVRICSLLRFANFLDEKSRQIGWRQVGGPSLVLEKVSFSQKDNVIVSLHPQVPSNLGT